jgi:hypothetical protein
MNKTEKPEIFLIKFGNYEHLLQLRDEGLLYMNPLPYFWKIEDEELRGDPFDGVSKIERGHKVTIGKEKVIGGKWIMRMHPPEPIKINIFCMYALRPLIEASFPVDERTFRFGEHALVLTNNDEFLRRIEFYLNSQTISFNADIVEYIEDDYIGEVGEFRKLKRFDFQSEWRLVCYDGPGKRREIRIGSIRDISTIIRSDEVNKEINIHSEPIRIDET